LLPFTPLRHSAAPRRLSSKAESICAPPATCIALGSRKRSDWFARVKMSAAPREVRTALALSAHTALSGGWHTQLGLFYCSGVSDEWHKLKDVLISLLVGLQLRV
jgi:hypothetical protein